MLPVEVVVTGNNPPSFTTMFIHHIQPKPYLHHQHSSSETKSLSVLRYIYTFLSYSPPGVNPRTPGHVRPLYRHQAELKDGLQILARTGTEVTNTSGSAVQQIVFNSLLQL